MRINKRLILLLILLLAILVILLPIRLDYSIDGTALVLPRSEWHLKRGQEDSFFSELKNNTRNTLDHVKSFKLERGDIAEVELRENLEEGMKVNVGDTLAFIHSYYVETEITRLENLLHVEEQNLKKVQTGEKQPLIDQANNKLKFAQQELDLQKKNYNRHLNLFNDSIISAAEFDLVENTYKLAEINVQIAEKELNALKSGSKPEEVDYIIAKINSYSRELASLVKMQNMFYVICPHDGVLRYNSVLNGVVSVYDTSSFLLKIPVRINELPYLEKISAIRLKIPGRDEVVEATFIGLEDKVNYSLNDQMVIAKAHVLSSNGVLYPGMMLQTELIFDKVTILNFLKRNINLNF